MSDQRRFPVLVGYGGGFSIPWSLVAPFEQQARNNHDQTLQRLAERGGLSPRELWAVMHCKDWDEASLPSKEDALTWARGLVDETAALRARVKELEVEREVLRDRIAAGRDTNEDLVRKESARAETAEAATREAIDALRALHEAASHVELKPCDGRSHTYPPTEPCEECENASFLSKRITDADAVLAKHPVKP